MATRAGFTSPWSGRERERNLGSYLTLPNYVTYIYSEPLFLSTRWHKYYDVKYVTTEHREHREIMEKV